MFIDATYEGDLMAAAGVDYHVGREANSVYGEKWNGVQTGVLHHRHHFGVLKAPISPYVVPGDPKSGVLPRISTEPPGEYGAGDKRVQAYCFRMCLTDHPENRIPFPEAGRLRPEAVRTARCASSRPAGARRSTSSIRSRTARPTRTTTARSAPTTSAMNYDYPEATYERRREIIKEHETYQKGWLYFIANDPRVPEGRAGARCATWGLPKDEFTDNGDWPHQIYVREARRMIGAYVMTENELLKKRPTPESVGMGSLHASIRTTCSATSRPRATCRTKATSASPTERPVPDRLRLARAEDAARRDNLLVPVCLSSSHIAYGSIRMEPVFMILGQSAATAAALAIDAGIAVQDVPYAKLRERLLEDGQVLEHAMPAAAGRN